MWQKYLPETLKAEVYNRSYQKVYVTKFILKSLYQKAYSIKFILKCFY